MRPHHLTADEVRAALRAAACQLAGKLPELPEAERAEQEVVYIDSGAVIVQFVPRGTIKVPATTQQAENEPVGKTIPRPILNLAEFAAELEERRRTAGLLSDAQRGDGTAVIDPKTGQRRPSPTEAEILKVCSRDTPLKGLAIARRLNREYDSYIRGVLASMVKRGVLRRASNGRGYLLDS
jgi:hypothetical protein